MRTNINYSLEEYLGIWTKTTASHLLRRTMFGPQLSEIENATSMGLKASLDQLLDDTQALPSPPLNYSSDEDPNMPVGTTWINSPFIAGKEFWRKASYRGWSIETLISQKMNIREKMTLFWINHFVVEMDNVGDARGVYELTHLFRSNAVGNFQKLVEEVTISQAMLIYLNGNTNKNGSPNENYARELLELFTIGKGPLIGAGNYTNYTEADIQEAARVLSGFITRKNPLNISEYKSFRHDKGEKQFSETFNSEVITNEEDEEYKTLIRMIFNKDETSKFICRKLYRWFVYYDIDAEVETKIIEPLAETLRSNSYEIESVLRQLLSSQHFFDQNFIGAQIKSPIDFTVGFVRQMEVQFPDTSAILAKYNLLLEVFKSTDIQLQSISDPPDVAGWKAYYQEPSFDRSWISSVTLSERSQFTDSLLSKNGIRRNQQAIRVDPLIILAQLSAPHEVNEVIDAFTILLLPLPITNSMRENLKEVLIPGLPDYEWTVEYDIYKNDPTDTQKKQSIQGKLLVLITAIKNLPATQLA